MFDYIFNLYDMMVLTITTLAVLLSLPLILKRERETSDLLLTGFLSSQGLIALFTVLSFNEQISPSFMAALHPFHYVPLTLGFALQGILLYWYGQSMMKRPLKVFRTLVALIVICLLANIGVELTFEPNNSPLYSHPKFVFSVVISSINIYLAWQVIVRLQKFDGTIRQHLSNIDNINLSWLQYVTIGFMLLWGLQTLAQVLGLFGYSSLCEPIYTFCNLPPLFLLCCMAVYSQTSLLNIKVGSLEEQKENHTKPEPKVAIEVCSKIDDLMKRVKIYQDPELRLEGLADSLDLSTRTVSTILNGHYQKSFYDFVNAYRIQDAAMQLEDPSHSNKTIQRIFEDAGFNSKTTFNTLFKKVIGKTPSEYRKQHQWQAKPTSDQAA